MEKPWRASFWSLIIAQFQSAFNDNTLKWLLTFWVVGMGLPEKERDTMVSVVAALFAAPFILFSLTGGWLADRFSKRTVTVAVRLAEIPVMALALAGLAAHHLNLSLAAMFLMAALSALFGPSKYGLLPELLPKKRLSWGNGILELGTFLAIIVGTVAGGLLFETFRGRQEWSGAVLVGSAALGFVISLGIGRVPAANPAKPFRANLLGDLWEQIVLMRRDRPLFLAVLGNTYFFCLAALLQSNILVYSQDVLKIGTVPTGYLNATLALAVGLGSVGAGYLSGGKIEYGLIPLGAIGITVFGFALALDGLQYWQVAALLAAAGASAGFFAVPINAVIQHRPPEDQKGGVIGASALLSWIGIGLAAGIFWLMKTQLGLSPRGIFFWSSALTVAATVYMVKLQPDWMLRLCLWLFTHTVYRIRVEGRDHLPPRGGALLVSNHLSFVDALLLIAATDRRIRFVMFKDIYDHPIVKPFAVILRAIPISSTLRPREMIRSLRAASEALSKGEVVCIFAEGQITRIGQLLPFRRGFERIMKGVEGYAPIVPVNLDGVWGSVFSFERGRFLWKFPRRPWQPMTVSFGQPMPPDSTAFQVRQAVQELHSEAYQHRKSRMHTLHRRFVRSARLYPRRFFMADFRVEKLTFGAGLMRTVFLARRLRPVWEGQEMVGILLPPSVPGALVNFAALLMGKVPVNLNYTASDVVLESCAQQCGLKTVITSQAFLERVKLKVPGQAVMLEDLAGQPRAGEKIAALLMAWTLPVGALERALGRRRKVTLDDLATIIFSSGSTGDPKGVMLTHYNVGSNIDQLGQTFFLDSRDRIMGILPFFHSFGFTGTLCLPAALGIGVVYHPSPLDAKAIGALAMKYAATFLLATPTFLQGFMRRCAPEEFGSLEYVLVGAEKLSDRVAAAFEEHFGIRPLEAYGATECAPAVTVNTRDFRAAGFRQVGGKRGKIGHPLPGVSVRIVDPDTGERRPLDEPGLLLVRGPNVMKGYLGKPEKTAEVLRDGWYVTGDIASVDEDGFLAITDRLSRFSKIGGEMVPHIRVEEKLHELAGATEQTFAVTGVPDPKKGERLVVLHTLAEEAVQAVIEKLAGAADLPNLWKPGKHHFLRVESLPYLGTGKLDLRRIRELAQAAATEA
jgi:acyl-[acyl-carrier-protein]-phospholipid O-acyltransferase/long-chain-fatty-acid--[acyl-carrier-protein] ligase